MRYPGGKTALANLIIALRRLNGLGHTSLAEPFAGGAGASLKLLFLEETRKIFINDLDSSIHDFWWSILHRPNMFFRRLKETEITIEEWRRQREIYRSIDRKSRINNGFSAFYLNRCNRSGIIMNGGPIGGYSQSGSWKIDARFNPDDLLKRCKKIYDYKDRIEVSCCDGIKFIANRSGSDTFLFIDPPYFYKGSKLYLNSLSERYHVDLSLEIKKHEHTNWILTYDDCEEIRDLYSGWANLTPFHLQYSASRKRKGREILITPLWMKIPTKIENYLCN